MNKIKKIVIILPVTIILLVIIQAFSIKVIDKKNNIVNIEETFDEINISEFRIKTIFDKTIKNRIIKRLNHKVFIGETDKQIENGYYDIETYIQNDKCIVISLNKLWKEFDDELYEEDYITEMTASIKEILGINVPQNKIYDYILSGYLAAKNSNSNIDDNKKYILDLDEYVMKGKVLEKEFVISIYKK